ncbi:hypothetical protein BDZ91DRAFT_153762 [Kalaharituber pfeilii]|nr:hypothetical protein BDZ91DRAFT_153762 [Kalaharituber pfeilii]
MSTPNGTVHDHNGTVYEGASPKDRLFRASSGNETGLFEEILEEFSDAEKRIEFLNESRDFSGNTALHLAALNGSCHLLDKLLKAADIEVNPLNSSGNTPLHVAVEYYAAHCDSYEGHIRGLGIVEMLLEQKADPRIQNNNNNKRPIDLIDLSDPGKTELRELLEDGIEAIEADEAEKAKDAEAKKAKEAEKAKEVEKQKKQIKQKKQKKQKKQIKQTKQKKQKKQKKQRTSTWWRNLMARMRGRAPHPRPMTGVRSRGRW